MNRQPQLMDVTRMHDILTPHLSKIQEHVFLNSELAMVRGDHAVFSLLVRQDPPFTINDYRLGIILSGEAVININLQDRHLTSGTLVCISPGTIINPKRLSDDFRIFGIALFSNFPMPFAQGQMPSAFNGQVSDFQIPASEGDIATAKHIMDTIWQTVRATDHYHRPTVTALVAAQMHHYDHLFQQQANKLASSSSREQTIFNRFLQLVTQHCAEHHQIGYYAERMCLTERYLSTDCATQTSLWRRLPRKCTLQTPRSSQNFSDASRVCLQASISLSAKTTLFLGFLKFYFSKKNVIRHAANHRSSPTKP